MITNCFTQRSPCFLREKKDMYPAIFRQAAFLFIVSSKFANSLFPASEKQKPYADIPDDWLLNHSFIACIQTGVAAFR